jgi:tetratricopeptide (TPR) repeat protein/TolB-like protein
VTSTRWEKLSCWYNEWLAADPGERERLRARLAAESPELVAEAEALAASADHLRGFLETPALMQAAGELALDDPLLSADSLIGPYQLVHLIGRGGSGDVYRATDTRLRRDVAVKVLAASRTSDPQRVERFLQEARVTAKLDHPNVVRIYDVGRVEERAYLVAELLEGETLRARISRGPMPVADVVRIGIEVARGLSAAHAAGLVHRDLKPDNLFLTSSGPTKILDFGIAKLAQTDADRDGLSTVTGVVLGTAGYLAPEQIRGEAIDARADLFALGSVLFEMLTGTRAFGRNHIVETLHAILHDAPPDLLATRDDLPAALTDLVARLLDKAPDRRPQSAADVIAALEHVPLDGTGRAPRAVASTGSGARVSTGWPLRRRVAVAAAMLVLVSVAAWFMLRSRSPLPETHRQPRLAVMPFQMTPAAEGADLLSLGLAALLVDRFGQRLIGVNTLAAADTRGWPTRSAAEAARRLGSTHVLSGKVAREGERVRVTAELFSSDGDRVSPLEPLEIDAGRGASIEDAIVSHIVPRVASALALRTRSAAASRASANPKANEASLRGRALVLRPVPADLRRAADFFQEAIALDPDVADTWAGLGSAYKRMPITGGMRADEAFPLAEKAARRALELDPDNAEALCVLGTKAFWYDWDYPAAEKYLKRALEVQPNHADSHLFLAHLYSNLGRGDDAINEIRVARDLDRQWPQPRALEGQFLTNARRHADALAHLDTVVNVTDPMLWTAHTFRSEALLALGRPADAMAALQRALQVGGTPFQHAQLPYFLARMGRTQEAEAALAKVPPQQSYARAMSLLALGRRDEAVAELNRAVEDRSVLVTFLGVDPRWDAMRGFQPFRDVARRVNLLEVSDRIAALYPSGQ